MKTGLFTVLYILTVPWAVVVTLVNLVMYNHVNYGLVVLAFIAFLIVLAIHYAIHYIIGFKQDP